VLKGNAYAGALNESSFRPLPSRRLSTVPRRSYFGNRMQRSLIRNGRKMVHSHLAQFGDVPGGM